MALPPVRVFQKAQGFQTDLHQELFPGLLRAGSVHPDLQAVSLPEEFPVLVFRMVSGVVFSLA